MKKKILLSITLVLLFTVQGAAANNTTSSNSTNSTQPVNEWNFTTNQVNRTFSVGTTDSLDLGLNATGNESEIVDIETKGNITDFIYSIQSPVQTIPGQTVRILNQVVVDRDQAFGTYNGTIKGVGGNETSKVNVSLKIVDDIPPEIVSTDIQDSMALTDNKLKVDVKDNLNISSVKANISKVETITQGNQTVQVNQTFKEGIVFGNTTGTGYEYILTDTDEIGQYYVNITATDSSNNTVSKIEGFQIEGLDSISVDRGSFTFSTIRPKEETRESLINSEIEGKEFSVRLNDLSYGGNETVRFGIINEESDSPTYLEVNESLNLSDSGDYSLVLLHQGSDEVKGVHSVTGSFTLKKPDQHVKPRSVDISFSGTVKNVDKPPETCTRVQEFDSCIAYSFSATERLFEDKYGDLDSYNQSHVFMISRLPTSEVEGTEEWSSSTSLAMGEYNKTLEENEELRDKLDRKVDSYWKILAVLFLVFGGGTAAFLHFIYPTFELDRKRFREKKIRKLITDDEKSFGLFSKVRN